MIWGGMKPLGYSGSEPPSEHCPDCFQCTYIVNEHTGRMVCSAPEEHELCSMHKAERKQEWAEHLADIEKEGGW